MMRLLAALSCAVATASAPCALELRIDNTDVTSLFDANANATAVADDLADRAGGSLRARRRVRRPGLRARSFKGGNNICARPLRRFAKHRDEPLPQTDKGAICYVA